MLSGTITQVTELGYLILNHANYKYFCNYNRYSDIKISKPILKTQYRKGYDKVMFILTIYFITFQLSLQCLVIIFKMILCPFLYMCSNGSIYT